MAQGFIDAQSRLAALQSTLAPAPTTSPSPGNVLPSSSVGSFRNQQLGGLTTGTSGVTGGSSQTTDPAMAQFSGNAPGQSGVSTIANQTLQNVQDARQRTNDLYNILAQKKAQQSQTAAPASGVSVSAGQPRPQPQSGGMGKAYQPNGQLSSARNQALKTAFSYVGDPYVLGGLSHRGIDCSGLVMAVYDQFGFGKYLNSHLSNRQAAAIPGVRTSVNNLRPGDIVAWRNGHHIAIYAGNGMIVAAAAPGEGVKYQRVWGDVFGIALRLPGE